MTLIVCANRFCRRVCEKSAGAVNRARKVGLNIYCSQQCAGWVRRRHKSEAEKKEEKRLYDKRRREELADKIKAQKAAYFQRTYDPARAAEQRKLRMPAHIEYCRRPEYREYKREYDRQRRARLEYGEFAEAFLLLVATEQEIRQRATRYEIYQETGRLNKSTRRKRAAARGTVALG